MGTGLMLGSLVGTALGVGLALWYTPRTGKQTQDALKRDGERFRNFVAEQVKEIKDTAKSVLKNSRDAVASDSASSHLHSDTPDDLKEFSGNSNEVNRTA